MAETEHHHHHHTSSRHRSSHHRSHHDYSTTGEYRIAGHADTSPIQIDGIEDTARDDRLDFHTFDPSKPRTHTTQSEQRQLREHKKSMRRKFRQKFFKVLLIVVGSLAALALLWVIVSTFGKARVPTPEDEILPAESAYSVTNTDY